MVGNNRKAEAQARACAQCLAHVLERCLLQHQPADRVLAALLRQHREYGSRDRRLISHTVFATLRWWGWLHELAPEAFRTTLESVQDSEKQTESLSRVRWQLWSEVLLAATMLEYDSLPSVCWRYTWHMKRNPRFLQRWQAPSNPTERMARIWTCLHSEAPKRAFPLRDLLPTWCFQEIHSGIAHDRLVQWLQKRPPLWLRFQGQNPQHVLRELKQAGLEAVAQADSPRAIKLEQARVNVHTLPAFRQGRIEIQDLASQVIGRVCAPEPGQRWWDACSGGGGKALQLASLMRSRGSVIASDIRAYKLKDLKRRARRGGFHNIEMKAWDGGPVSGRRSMYDGVLVDAPCTCSGTWRRNPDGRWRLAPAEVGEMADLQLQILTNAAPGVRPGGVLVYATCSMFQRENEGVVDRFLSACEGFFLEPFFHPLSGKKTSGMLMLWPWEYDTDAMFVARLRRHA